MPAMTIESSYQVFVKEMEKKTPESLMAHCSPNVELYSKGEPKAMGLGPVTQVFMEQWAQDYRPPRVLETKELVGEHAMLIKSVDAETNKIYTTTYSFGPDMKIVKMETDYGF